MNCRITLYLNQFFQDHRSVCRIFVNSKMQTIKDLQDHISKIFNIKNFVLMAQNQYLPSVESVMVLQQDDIITAVPVQTSSIMCTSTPFGNNNQASLDTLQQSSRVQDTSSDSEEEQPHKRKKSSEAFKKPRDLPETIQDVSPIVRSLQKAAQDENTNVTSRKEKKLKKYNLLNQDLEEPCSAQKVTETEEKGECSTGEIKKSKSKVKKYESVREKVMYFESKDVSVEQNKTMSKTNSPETPHELDISDTMRKHKLFVKSNKSCSKMSMELPKTHNKVESIVVKNSSQSSSGFKSIDTSLQSKNDLVNSNTDSNPITSEKSLVNNISCNNIISSEQNSFTYKKPIDFKEESIENTLEKSLKIEEDNNEVKKSPEKPKILQNIILQPAENKKTYSNTLQESKEPKASTNDVEVNEIEVPLSNLSMETEHVSTNATMEGSTSLDFGQHVTKRKRVRKRKSRKSKEVPMDTVPIKPNYDFKLRLPKASPVLHIRFDDTDDTPGNNDNNASQENNGTLPEEIDCSFPKENNCSYPQHASCSLPQDPSYLQEEKSCDVMEKNIPMDEEQIEEMDFQKEIVEGEEEEVIDKSFGAGDNVLEAQEKVELVDNSVHEEDFLEYVSKTVEKCPFMLNPPEVGNTIAFKIWKITGSYTPEISNYIIGKVLNISEDQNTVMINILAGLEETRRPTGKFSLETEEDDPEAYQEYEWNTMMEKRLVSK